MYYKKRILITGANSYIGTKFKEYVSENDGYEVSTIDLLDDNWKLNDFSFYDVVLHVAALVHKKEKKKDETFYYKVNSELAYEVADKAKKEGVKQFIFMSSIAVYGIEGEIGKNIEITKNTICKPVTYYGKSKLKAENILLKLSHKDFKISIIRAPIIYGPDCPGNYTNLQKFITQIPIFPKMDNKRSMLFIDNLSEFIKILIDKQDSGLFFPQNKEYVNIKEMVELIAKENKKKLFTSKMLAIIVILMGKRISLLNKIFGNLVINQSMSNYQNSSYCVVDFNKSIKICENKLS